MRKAFLISLVLLAAACSQPDNAPGPGGVTVGEAKALDEAAAMLDQRQPPAEAFAPDKSAELPSGAASPVPAQH